MIKVIGSWVLIGIGVTAVVAFMVTLIRTLREKDESL